MFMSECITHISLISLNIFTKFYDGWWPFNFYNIKNKTAVQQLYSGISGQWQCGEYYIKGVDNSHYMVPTINIIWKFPLPRYIGENLLSLEHRE